MPLVPNRTTSEEIGFAQSRRATAHWRRDGETADRITIGVVNNMPDGALKATERQFTSLLQAAGEGRSVRLRFFALAEIPRGQVAAAHIAANYGDLGELTQTSLDGLIVTGKEPRVPSLSAEPYWQSFTKLVDWAEHNTVSTIWSCLAAHAAVLHLDGVARHPLPRKRFGVFNCHAIAPDPLLAGAPPSLRVAHSRYNDLREAELAASGYRVLTRSPQAGVDMFVKRWRSLFVFLQGHPEYGPDSLAREYRRDVGRY